MASDEDNQGPPDAGDDNQNPPDAGEEEQSSEELQPAPEGQTPGKRPPRPPIEEAEDEEDGMLRMSFMDHLEELRSRIIKALMGIGVAFFLSLIFANQLWTVISQPAVAALTQIGVEKPALVFTKPMEPFSIIWVKLPMLTAIFIASPWILYQVWAFIAPGLYKRERNWAAPFIISAAGLFILGGLFAYFVAFRFGLTFLLGLGVANNLQAMVTATDYFNIFVNITLGVGLIFELPVLIFFLTLLRIVTPGFLFRNSRYAVLLIVIAAALITPTPDPVNLMLLAVPMCLLYFGGVFAGYMVNLHRDQKRFPWGGVLLVLLVILIVLGLAGYVAVVRFGYQFQWTWPFLVQ